jgi:hypothetical protein
MRTKERIVHRTESQPKRRCVRGTQSRCSIPANLAKPKRRLHLTNSARLRLFANQQRKGRRRRRARTRLSTSPRRGQQQNLRNNTVIILPRLLNELYIDFILLRLGRSRGEKNEQETGELAWHPKNETATCGDDGEVASEKGTRRVTSIYLLPPCYTSEVEFSSQPYRDLTAQGSRKRKADSIIAAFFLFPRLSYRL